MLFLGQYSKSDFIYSFNKGLLGSQKKVLQALSCSSKGKGQSFCLHGAYPLGWGKTHQTIVCQKRPHWLFVQNNLSFSLFKDQTPRKHWEVWHILFIPNNPLELVNAVINTGKPTKESVSLTYIEEANTFKGL